MAVQTVLSEEDIVRMVEVYKTNNLPLRMLAMGFKIKAETCKRILVERGVYDGQSRLKKSRKLWGRKY